MPGETDPVAKPARQPSGAGSDIDDIARGWVLPSEDDVSAVWASAEIVLDTNVLLNLYRYSAKARDELLSLLTHIGSRLWLPHQVAHEFFRNRMAVRVLDQTAEEKLTAAVDAAAEILLKQVDKMNADLSRRNEPPPHEARIREALENLRGELVAVEKKRAGDLGSHHDDEVLRAFRRLFGQRVGREPTPDDRTELYAEGKKRYER
ncbi:MAG: PIN-like domain-containing protein, partial [Solirubrobacteraceae bacterium]